MSKVKFTPEQQEFLRNNPYTVNVTPDLLYLSKEFKELFYKEYQTGSLPREILHKYGYPTEILGKKRIWGIAYCIKKEYERNGFFTDIRSVAVRNTSVPKAPEDRMKYLEHQVKYLTEEVEFLKKISSIRNTGK